MHTGTWGPQCCFLVTVLDWNYKWKTPKMDIMGCCGQLWVRHMFCGQTCDELYHFTFFIARLGIPLGSQPIKFALARVPSLRLYSEIDHIHPSSEAQCVSRHLPLVDCHMGPANESGLPFENWECFGIIQVWPRWQMRFATNIRKGAETYHTGRRLWGWMGSARRCYRGLPVSIAVIDSSVSKNCN